MFIDCLIEQYKRIIIFLWKPEINITRCHIEIIVTIGFVKTFLSGYVIKL